jgi:hypothetical protein
MPTIIAVTLRAAGLYLGGNRISGVGSMIRWCCGGGRGANGEGRIVEGQGFAGRGAEGAGFAKEVEGFGGGWTGDGAVAGLRGRGIVVVRWVGGVDFGTEEGCVGDVIGDLVVGDCDGASDTGVLVGAAGVGLAAAALGCNSGIEVLVGAAGVGCNGPVTGGIV